MCLCGFISTSKAGPTAWTQIKNNNHIIDQQKNGRDDPMATGTVTIDFYGHAAFKMTSPGGLTMLFDPWCNDPSAAWGIGFLEDFPEPEVDAIPHHPGIRCEMDQAPAEPYAARFRNVETYRR